MSKREWKPGDVAMVRQLGGDERIAIVGRYSRNAALNPPHFVYANGGYDDVRGKAHDARPLVVIDPEDPKAVERLAGIFCARPSSGWVEQIQQALREFADLKPSKPEEPTGLGAVVEVSDGTRYVSAAALTLDESCRWVRADSVSYGISWYYVNFNVLDVVKVLSEGVIA